MKKKKGVFQQPTQMSLSIDNDIMEIDAIQKIYGTAIHDTGHVVLTWNEDETLNRKELYVDDSLQDKIYTKRFFWNANKTLNRWELVVESTGEKIVKRFTFDADQLKSTGTKVD